MNNNPTTIDLAVFGIEDTPKLLLFAAAITGNAVIAEGYVADEDVVDIALYLLEQQDKSFCKHPSGLTVWVSGQHQGLHLHCPVQLEVIHAD